MSEEKEVKIRLRDSQPLDSVIERVEKLGFQKVSEKTQVDSYFDFPDFRLCEKAQALRIRSENGIAKCFEFKVMFYLPCRKNPWFVEEICADFPISDSEKVGEIFDLLGLEKLPANYPLTPETAAELLKENGIERMFEIKKQRSSFRKKGTMIELDSVEGLGNFLEIESAEKDAGELLHEFGLGELGFEVKFGYTSLYLEKFYGKDLSNLKEKFAQNPEWNLLESELSFYKRLCEKES